MKIFICGNTLTTTFIYKILSFFISKGVCKEELLIYVDIAYKKERENKNG